MKDMNKEDFELLSLAAKAAGIKIEFDEVSGLFWLDDKYTQLWWNPLYNDGDAFRLAVSLGLSIDFAEWVNTVFYGVDKFVQEGWKDVSSIDATRRAIVRSAAEIGKAMP